MKLPLLICLFVFTAFAVPAQTSRNMPEVTREGKGRVDTRIDNIGYWMHMVRMGYVKPEPPRPVPTAFFMGSEIRPRLYPPDAMRSLRIINSPDVPVTGNQETTQSENSVFIDPQDENVALNSNNSSSWISGYALNPWGADALYTDDHGATWAGSVNGVNGTNAGDPATAIGPNGWWYVGRIAGDYGQAVSYSKDQGKTWTRVRVAYGPTAGIGLLDKNHLWIDQAPSSPFQGYLYTAWTNFIPGDPDTNQVEIARSADQGLTWSSPLNISSAAAALKLNHGVNLQTGPDGELYAAWSIYDTWPSDETAIGFTRSFDGGGVFSPATRIMQNIKGIRASMTGKNMRVNSFPSMAVDLSTGPHRGTLYLVWANRGVPGINTGDDIDVWLIRSSDQGATWSPPLRVNQDPPGLGKQHYFPWISCDPVTGSLTVIYYDDRDADSSQAAAFVSCSWDGGNSWTDMQVSDVVFTPQPIPGLAFSYFGDYIGIQTRNMNVYPVWTDNRDNGRAMTWVSPFDLGPNPGQPWVVYHSDSLATVAGTGNVTLNYGDSLHLSLGLKNLGDQPASGVLATVTTASPWILVTDSTETYGDMGPGATAVVPNGFAFRVSDTIPDGKMIRFDVKAETADSSWFSHFSLESHAPSLAVSSMIVDDAAGGNGNGRAEPGESLKLRFPVMNTGDFACSGAWARLQTVSPYLSLPADSVFLGTIPARGAKTAVYDVQVSASTPMGTGCDLALSARAGLFHADRDFRLMVGQAVEDWETNSFTRYPWQQGGAKPWIISSWSPWEGLFSAASGTINDYQNSQLILSFASASDDSIRFFLRTSTEDGYDFLMFYIDNVLQGQWSGETPWTRAAFPVAAGQHTFKWLYLKDLALSNGFDRVWVDFISLPPPVLPAVQAGPDASLCRGLAAILSATSSQQDSVRWTTTGDGLFGNDTSLTTTYLAGPADWENGSVTLILTGYNPYGSAADSKVLTFLPWPSASITVSPNDTVCFGMTVTLSAPSAGVTSWEWLPGPLAGNTVQYDTSAAGGAGTRRILLTTRNSEGCIGQDSVFLTFRDCTGTEEEQGPRLSVHPNPCPGLLFVEATLPAPATISLRIADAADAVVYRAEDEAPAGVMVRKISMEHLPDGIYLLTLRIAGQTCLRKVVLRK